MSGLKIVEWVEELPTDGDVNHRFGIVNSIVNRQFVNRQFGNRQFVNRQFGNRQSAVGNPICNLQSPIGSGVWAS